YDPLTIVCNGCFSNMRKSLSAPKVESPCFVGLILENCELPHANHGHVILGDPSLILFYPISSTEVRCLVDIPGTKVPSVANGEMANYLKTGDSSDSPTAIQCFYGCSREMMAANPVPTPGALLLGDSFNMRHPFEPWRHLSYGPVSLLSGLNPRPLHLSLHFFVVAIYGVGHLMFPFPSPKRIWLGARLILSASGIIFPIIKGKGVRQMFFPATVPAYY
ncbi:squalene monooxygenase SE1-like, partial [Argentina anserina]|uniref:squalene monooxygenase SE1-like n=1 Tax=Argentina anserina TaxID=57926 RepID=UPI00217646F1